MQVRSLLGFLVGRRSAIHDIANSRDGLVVGALLVVSAGFAREYDAEYLVAEPWHVLIPLAASIVASLLFFTLAYAIGRGRQIGAVGFLRTYRPFLTLFWMTAPLAWLYALPVERWLSAGDATIVNLWLLHIVSIWRVLLMIRVMVVFFGCSAWAATCCVMLVADITMLTALAYAPLPILHFMGGIRLSDSARAIAGAAMQITFLGVFTMPVWLIGVCVVASKRASAWTVMPVTPVQHPARKAVALAAGSVVAWFAVLPWTQREQELRYRTEALLGTGRVVEGLAVMSRQRRSDYPPHWDPPPRREFRIDRPEIGQVMLAMESEPQADWVRAVYLRKFEIELGIEDDGAWGWPRMDRAEVDRLVSALERLPEGPLYACRLRESSESVRDYLGDTIVDRIVALAASADCNDP